VPPATHENGGPARASGTTPRARRLRAPLLLTLGALLAFEALGGLTMFFARVAWSRRPGVTLHILAGIALTLVYAVYQLQHWNRVSPFRARLDYALGLLASLAIALTNLTGLVLAWPPGRYGLGPALPPGSVPVDSTLVGVHDVGSMLVLTFACAHLGAVLQRDERGAEGTARARRNS
jgi:hypothetical protein